MRQLWLLIPLLWCAQAFGAPVFTFVQQCQGTTNTVTTSGATCSGSGTLGAGHLLVVLQAAYGSAAPTFSFSDGGTNTYTSPSATCSKLDGSGTNRSFCFAYVLSLASTAALTITTTLGGSGVNAYGTVLWELSYTGGPIAFDTGIAGCSGGTPPSCTGATATTPVNIPTIVPGASGEALINFAFTNGSQTVCNSPWTNSSLSTVNGNLPCYLTSSSGSVAMNTSDATTPDVWIAGIVAFGSGTVVNPGTTILPKTAVLPKTTVL